MSSTMTTPTTQRITSIASVVQGVLARKAQPLPCSPLIVCPHSTCCTLRKLANWIYLDSKQVRFLVYVLAFRIITKFIQARDLVSVLTESKQQIDPRLHEMARYGGGGGGGGRYGGGRGRGGGRGGFTSSNAAPMGGGRRW